MPMTIDGALQMTTASLANINSQMAVISQNVANVNTPGYSQEVSTQTSVTVSGQGMGVATGPAQRQLNFALQSQLIGQNATVAGLTTTSTALSGIDAAQGTPGQNNDLPSLLGQLQNAFTSLQADPSSTASQQLVVSAAGTLTGQINALSQAYGTARQTAQNGVVATVGALNASLATITNLTQQIMQGRATGQSTADLENQRDAAITTASALVAISFVNQPDGGLLAITQGGLGLQMLNPPPQFAVSAATISASTHYPGGGIGAITLGSADVTGNLTGGQLGADLTLRDTTLPTYQGALDEFANTLNTRFASQGLQLFTPPAGSTGTATPTPTPTPTQTGYVGYAGSIAVNPAVLSSPALVRDGTTTVTGSATGASTFTPNPSGGAAGFGTLIQRVLTYSFGSDIQPGVPQPTPASTGLGPSGTLTAPFQAPTDLASFASDLVASQSVDVASTTNQLSSAKGVQQALQTSFNASSNVSVDSEMSKMVELQNAYSASGHIIAAVQSMWTDLMNMVQPLTG
jgi:flagellar hook-associated protein 1 FlgK